jgi:hypothetical protein
LTCVRACGNEDLIPGIKVNTEQTDLDADHQVATTLAELIIGGSLVSMEIGAE